MAQLTYLLRLLFAISVFSAAPLWADDSQYQKKAATAVISAEVYDELTKAQEAQEKGDIATALRILDGLKARTGRKALQPYELAQMWNFYAYAYLAKEDFKGAIQAFNQLLAQPDIPQQLIDSTRYTLAQLYFAEGDVAKAASLLEQWFKTAENPAAEAYVMLAQMYLQMEKFDPALTQLLKAFEVAKAQQKEAKENWYALLQYIYAEKRNYKKQVEVLEILVNRWPKRNYWLAMMGAYAELNMDKKQLAAMDAAYQQGMLDQESYLISYAQMLMANSQPYQAAKVLQQALDKQQVQADAKNYERLGEYYRLAQENQKAIPYLQKAAELSDDGEVAIRLAYVYLNRYMYKEAVAAVEMGLKKGKVHKTLDAQFLLGQAQFQAGMYEQSRATLKKVVHASKEKELQRLNRQASQWLNYIDAEIKRQQEIKAFLRG